MRTKLFLIMVAAMIVSGVSVLAVSASSHREAPLTSVNPQVDGTDLYAWVDASDPTMVNLVANYYPFQEPSGGPNFYRFADDVLYAIHIDSDGDAVKDITYRFLFDTEVANPDTFLYNTGPITTLDDADLMVPPANVGPASIPDYESVATEAVYDLGGGVTAFAGPRDDPFFVELGGIFDLLTFARTLPGSAGDGVDGLGGFNVMTIAVQVPIADITDGEQPVIGVWTTAARRQVTIKYPQTEVHAGKFVQVSRLGSPLVNEVVIPMGKKDKFNSSAPKFDAQFLSHVTDPELAALINLLYGGVLNPGGDPADDVPETGRGDLVAAFLTGIPGVTDVPGGAAYEALRLNTSVAPSVSPDPLGALASPPDLAGFPNGRRPVDDVNDIAILAVACGYGPDLEALLGLCNISPTHAALGDGVDANDVPFLTDFPYLERLTTVLSTLIIL